MTDEQTTQSEENESGGMPYQLDVYFREMPEIDPEALGARIDALDPTEGAKCMVVQRGTEEIPDGTAVGMLGVTIGDMVCMAIFHDVQSPSSDVISESPVLPDEMRADLLSHKAHAMLTTINGDEFPPVEKIIFMYVIAAAMAPDGAIGFGNPYTRKVFPIGALTEVMEAADEDENTSLWDSLRQWGEPFDLLVDIGRIELDDKHYLATCGYGFCGLPDFVWEWDDEHAEETFDMFKNGFEYMMENGPVIGVGHTMGYDENVAYRFDEMPEDLELPWPTDEVLFVTREEQKRKKFLGIF